MSYGVGAVSVSSVHIVSKSNMPLKAYNNKILSSARNGELILWDLNKPGASKYGKLVLVKLRPDLIGVSERKARDHVRSIHCLAYSVVSQNYCTTGSADGDLRVWVS